MAIKLRLAKFFLGRIVPLDDNDIIPSNNLGTGGTGAGTKYLADDGTFKTVSTGGGTSSNVLIDCGTILAPNENVLIDCGAI